MALTVVTFTGSRKLTPMGRALIGEVLARIVGASDRRTQFVTGACIGADDFIAGQLLTYFTVAPEQQTIVVPADRSRVTANLDWFRDVGARVEYMPEGSSYENRDWVMVEIARLARGGVVGFPAWPEHHPESRRSGTWLTLKLARKAGIVPEVHLLTPELISKNS